MMLRQSKGEFLVTSYPIREELYPAPDTGSGARVELHELPRWGVQPTRLVEDLARDRDLADVMDARR